MTTRRHEQVRGAVVLLADATLAGATAVERIHRQHAALPFQILEAIPIVSLPAAIVHAVHDAVLFTTYGSIRTGARIAKRLARGRGGA